jgi:hypothetical protein
MTPARRRLERPGDHGEEVLVRLARAVGGGEERRPGGVRDDAPAPDGDERVQAGHVERVAQLGRPVVAVDRAVQRRALLEVAASSGRTSTSGPGPRPAVRP